MENYTLSDIRAATEGDGMFGGGSWWVVILLLFAMSGGTGLFGGRSGSPVTEADLCTSNSFMDLKNSVGRMGDQMTQGFVNTQNGLATLGYETLKNFNETQGQIANCCCEAQRAIDGVKFDMSNYAAAINANTTAVGQKILDKMCENEKNALQARVQQLELQNALCGVIRYPQAATYAAPYNPFFGAAGCGCGNI